MTYITENEIDQMADAAVSSYEMTASWNAAYTAAFEFAVDELGVKPRHTAVLVAVKRAKTEWEALKYSTKKIVEHYS